MDPNWLFLLYIPTVIILFRWAIKPDEELEEKQKQQNKDKQ